MPKFYDRIQEIDSLEQIEKNSQSSANFTVMTGRRRIGRETWIKDFWFYKKTF